jgi:hypothetical protein
MRPNLFRRATPELSQDAFFCWLLEWLKYSDHVLADASWRLFDGVFRGLDLTIQRDSITSVHIKRQFQNVDIVAVIELTSQQKICLVIEDKVDASLTGSDQLQRNVENVMAHAGEWAPLSGIEQDRVFGVFLKTGHDFDLVSPRGYTKVVNRDFNDWVEHLPTESLGASDILASWLEWRLPKWGETEGKVVAATKHIGDVASGKWADNRIWDSQWADPVYQYTLFKHLFRVDPKDISKVEEHRAYRVVYFHPFYDRGREEYFLLGTSRGRSWIQYHFDSLRDEFFYRLDWKSGMWGISLRFSKKDKSADDLSRMREIAAVLDYLLKTRDFVTSLFRPTDTRVETTCLLIDPYRSAGLLELAAIHADFIRTKFVV